MNYRHLCLVSLLFLTGCSDYQWGWYVLDPSTEQGLTNIKFLVAGFNDTIQVSLLSMLFAMTIGLIIALPALSDSPILKWINRVYVEVIRSIPVLVLLLWVYYGMPTLLDVSLNHFWAGVIALTIAESAFMAEVFRGGIQAISRGQHEAAESLGLNYWQKMRLVILPQAFRQILPPLGNQFVYILKMSSLVSVIRVPPEQGDLEGVAGAFLQGLSGQLVAPCFIQLRVTQRQIDPGHAPGFSGESGQQSPEQTGNAAVHSVRKKSDQSQRGDCGHTFNSLDFWIGSSAHGERV